jgi:hypothetical protein
MILNPQAASWYKRTPSRTNYIASLSLSTPQLLLAKHQQPLANPLRGYLMAELL